MSDARILTVHVWDMSATEAWARLPVYGPTPVTFTFGGETVDTTWDGVAETYGPVGIAALETRAVDVCVAMILRERPTWFEPEWSGSLSDAEPSST